MPYGANIVSMDDAEPRTMFTDRREAGRALARELQHLRKLHPVILALPRGGVPLGLEIALALHAPLRLALVRKIGAPGQPELAIGAVAEGNGPELVTDPRLLAVFQIDQDWLAEAKQAALQEMARRRALYLSDLPPIDPSGRVAILVDDGIATGATMRAALRAIRHQGAKRLIVATAVGSPHAMAMLEPEADDIICLQTPADFMAVGQFYRHFPQLTDQEVIDHLREAARVTEAPPA
jgi:putative phosphoribosyl transferase